jgi:surface antigen
MVIFRIFFNLFHIVSRSLFGIFWLPFSIIGHHPLLFIAVLGLLFFWLFSSSDDQQVKQARNANPTRIVQTADGQKVQLASPVRQQENGDSAFANDLYIQMTEPERAQYSQTFFQVMGSTPDGQAHSWSGVDIAGALRPDHSFTNKSGERCRTFSETLKVHSVQQQITGIACEEGGGRWCKLSAAATPACNLGHNPSALDSIRSSWRKLF